MLPLEKSSSRYGYEPGQLSLPGLYLCYALFTPLVHFAFPWTQRPQGACDIQHLKLKHDFKKG